MKDPRLDATLPCWHCAGDVSPRALFCHACGSIQPPGDVDPFTRLGVAASFELDTSLVDRQMAGFTRILTSSRFQEKGARAAELAVAQLLAREQAAAILRDPAARARALLVLAGSAPARPANGGEWEIAVASAADAASRAKVVSDVQDDMDYELHMLLHAFQLGDLTLAATRLTRVETMGQAIAAAGRLT